MSPSIFLVSCLVILVSLPTNMASSLSLIQFACSYTTNHTETELCLQIFPTIPKIVAATDMFNLSIAIIESGISNSTNTLKRMETLLNQTSKASRGVKGALHKCKLQYEEVVTRFTEALRDVKDSDYEDATYDLMTAISDYLVPCQSFLAEQNVRDAVISVGNRVVQIFGLSATWVVEEAGRRSRLSPPPSASR